MKKNNLFIPVVLIFFLLYLSGCSTVLMETGRALGYTSSFMPSMHRTVENGRVSLTQQPENCNSKGMAPCKLGFSWNDMDPEKILLMFWKTGNDHADSLIFDCEKSEITATNSGSVTAASDSWFYEQKFTISMDDFRGIADSNSVTMSAWFKDYSIKCNFGKKIDDGHTAVVSKLQEFTKAVDVEIKALEKKR